MNAQDIQALEPMTFEHTGGNVWTLYTGEKNANGYYEFAIGPFAEDGTCPDDWLWVCDDRNGDVEVECRTVDAVRTAISALRGEQTTTSTKRAYCPFCKQFPVSVLPHTSDGVSEEGELINPRIWEVENRAELLTDTVINADLLVCECCWNVVEMVEEGTVAA